MASRTERAERCAGLLLLLLLLQLQRRRRQRTGDMHAPELHDCQRAHTRRAARPRRGAAGRGVEADKCKAAAPVEKRKGRAAVGFSVEDLGSKEWCAVIEAGDVDQVIRQALTLRRQVHLRRERLHD
jgi:hypothetical protein